MYPMVIAILLTLIPFLLVFCCKNRIYSFLSVFTTVVGFHLLLALVSQTFHVFNYPVIIVAHSIFAIVMLVVLVKNRTRFYESVRAVSFRSMFRPINLIVLAAFCIIFFELWSVHFNYTGTISTINGYEQVTSYSNPYPIFSDEWVGIAFSNYAIASHSLPLANPLFKNSFFFTFLMPFHSMIAEVFLFLGSAPLYTYAYLAIFVGMIICFLVYLCLRSYDVSQLYSVLTVLFLPFLANGTNMPGLWYVIPVSGGLIFFFVCIAADRFEKNILIYIAGIISLVLYPPIIIFVGSLFVARYIPRTKKIFDNKYISGGLVVFFSASFIIYFSNKFFFDNYIYRTNLVGGIPSFPLWIIVPWFLLPFFAIGLWNLFKRKAYPVLISIAVCFIFWISYDFTMNVFVIDYPRVVFTGSILIIFVTGFGLEWFGKKITAYLNINRQTYVYVSSIIMILCFCIISFSYTSLSPWNKLVLTTYDVKGNSNIIGPTAPSDQYLTLDDIRLFRNIHNKVIVTVPWKGLVIGVAEDDYPLQSKGSEITNNILFTQDFINNDCTVKNFWSRYFNISYVYLAPFDCPDHFITEGTSSEGLVLYKYIQ